MMDYVVGLPLLAFAAVLQATVLSLLRPFGGTVDVVLLLVLSWTLVGEWPGGPLWALIGGLCLDLLSGGRVNVRATEATLGYGLRQYHVGVVCWSGDAVAAADNITRLPDPQGDGEPRPTDRRESPRR